MGIERKEACLREIAAAVGKGGFEFEGDSRLSMDGGRSYVRSISYDPDRGAVSFTLCDREGRDLASAYGTRRLESLPQEDLARLSREVRRVSRSMARRQEQERGIAEAVRKNGRPSGVKL